MLVTLGRSSYSGGKPVELLIKKRKIMSNLQQITDQSFKQEVLDSNVPVLVDFWAEWCAPCRALAPMLEEVAGEFGAQVKVLKINIDENPDTPAQFGVRSIPTMILFKGGQQVDQLIGRPATKDPIAHMIKRSL